MNKLQTAGYRTNRVITLIITLVTAMALPSWAAKTSPPTDGDVDVARRLENAFEKVADRTSESVVVITSTKKMGSKASASGEEDGNDQFEGTPFEYFFRQMPKQHPRDVDSQGSGIILRKDGYILTNNHVVDGADTIKVRLKDGREFEAKLIGGDPAPRTDIAVIKIDAKDLSAAQLGDSEKVKVGQWAIAIGAPYELDYSFTVGFVSAKGRSAVWGRGENAYEDYIQTDASINPGNSGGPLCDIEGRVIGMNTLIRGINRGIGFAIPINMARTVADQLIEKGKVVRSWIGVELGLLSDYESDKEALALPKNLKDGLIVFRIHPDTPAAASDLKPTDIIVAVDGTPVKTIKQLQVQILRKPVGQKVTLDVVRDGKPTKVALQTAEMPDETQFASRQKPGKAKTESAFGLTVQTLTKELAQRLNLDDMAGVVVTEVAEGSTAQERGLQHGDVITEVGRQPVHSADEFKKAIATANSKDGVLLYVKRNGTSTFVVLKEKE